MGLLLVVVIFWEEVEYVAMYVVVSRLHTPYAVPPTSSCAIEEGEDGLVILTMRNPELPSARYA